MPIYEFEAEDRDNMWCTYHYRDYDMYKVDHCFHQLIRFAHLARTGKIDFATRAVQFGLNLGRVQELLRSPGGVDAWWGVYEPLLKKEDWART
jgi:hypothetical protein